MIRNRELKLRKSVLKRKKKLNLPKMSQKTQDFHNENKEMKKVDLGLGDQYQLSHSSLFQVTPKITNYRYKRKKSNTTMQRVISDNPFPNYKRGRRNHICQNK